VLTASVATAARPAATPSTTADVAAHVGTWACTGTFDATFTSPQGLKPIHGSGPLTAVVIDNGDGTVTNTVTDSDGACAWKENIAGMTATVPVGQSCHRKNATITMTSLSITVNGTTATGRSVATVTANTDSGPQVSQWVDDVTCTKR